MVVRRSCAEHWFVGGKARVRRGEMWSRLSVGDFAPVTKGSRSAWPCARKCKTTKIWIMTVTALVYHNKHGPYSQRQGRKQTTQTRKRWKGSLSRWRKVGWSRPSRCLVIAAHRVRVEGRGWQCDDGGGFHGVGRSLAQTQSGQGAERIRTVTSFRNRQECLRCREQTGSGCWQEEVRVQSAEV
jgi:hypothetical protein